MAIIIFVLLIILAYLLGSIPTAYYVFRGLTKGKDIRNFRSFNAGATNLRYVLKELGIANYNKWFIFTIIADGLKAAIPISIIFFSENLWMLGPVSLIAVLGHIFPLFIPTPKFRGGKGAATTIFGVYLPIVILYITKHPKPSVILLAIAMLFIWGVVYCLGMAWKSQEKWPRANLALIISIATLFFGGCTFLTNDFSIFVLWFFIVSIAIIVAVAHRSNWRRLINNAKPPGA